MNTTDVTPSDITPTDITPETINETAIAARDVADAPVHARHDIVGWGADADFANRPGYPQDVKPPRPIGHGRPGKPEQQTFGTPSVPSKFRRTTEVYGTAIPARGLSGVLRRYAYSIPDYKPSRWATLLFADRVDVLEHSPVKLLVLGGLVAAGVAVAMRPRRTLLDRILGRRRYLRSM